MCLIFIFPGQCLRSRGSPALDGGAGSRHNDGNRRRGRCAACIFHYGERETEYLRRRDKRLGAVIERVGHIERAVDPDLFSAVVHHIVGQQVSMRAQAAIWARMQAALGEVSARRRWRGWTRRRCGAWACPCARRSTYWTSPAACGRAGSTSKPCGSMDDARAIAALTSLQRRGRVDGGDDPAVLP